MATNLLTFERELVSLIGRPTNLRPFVCDASPLQSDVFLVGFNPATEMSTTDFWTFWRPGVGFEKDSWLAAYKEARRTRPLKPGRRRPHNELSNTRRVLKWIGEELSSVRILETNLYWRPTHRATDLPPTERKIEPFRWLLATIAPRVVVAYGNEACLALQELGAQSALLIRVPHLSRGWSRTKARWLSDQIRRELEH